MARSKTAANAILYYEAGQTYVPMAALTDAADGVKWTSPNDQWSGYEAKEPIVRPDGLLTGGVIIPAVSTGTNEVDAAAATAYVAGALVNVGAGTDLACLRGAGGTNVCRINSIIITAGSFAVESGTAGPTFSPTRGGAGGPPLIPVASVEVGQVRFGAVGDAVVASAEIFQVPGTHQERSDYPVWDEDWAEGEISFAAVVPAVHAGTTRRQVFAAYYTPIYAEVPNAADFVPAETTHSVTSTQIYGGTVGARSATLGQGSFTARLSTGVIDNFIKNKNKNLWFKFLPDRYRAEYVLTQGVLGVSRQFPAGNSIMANCTISADVTSIDVEK